MENSFKDMVKSSILEAARILNEKADELSNDIDIEMVSEICVGINLQHEYCPELEISKRYKLIR